MRHGDVSFIILFFLRILSLLAIEKKEISLWNRSSGKPSRYLNKTLKNK